VTITTLTYNSETWELTRKQRQKIEIPEMKFLITVVGYTLRDQIRNTVIRNNRNIFSLNNRIPKQLVDSTTPEVTLEGLTYLLEEWN
jgi:hypothetical protein